MAKSNLLTVAATAVIAVCCMVACNKQPTEFSRIPPRFVNEFANGEVVRTDNFAVKNVGTDSEFKIRVDEFAKKYYAANIDSVFPSYSMEFYRYSENEIDSNFSEHHYYDMLEYHGESLLCMYLWQDGVLEWVEYFSGGKLTLHERRNHAAR